MRHLRVWITLSAMFTAVFLLHGTHANAQTDAPRPPLFDLLARTPDNENARASWSYVDYHAMITSREGAVVPTSYQDWLTADESEQAATRSVNAALFGINAGPNLNLNEGEGYSEAIGIDFFQIERAVSYGRPPAQVAVLQGDFDPAAIAAAYSARGYEASTVPGLTRYCGASGCENGAMINFDQRNPGDPFGGNVGRQQPVFVFEGDESSTSRDLVASAVLLDELTAFEAVSLGDNPSLLDKPAYRAAAEAITQTGLVRQALFEPADQMTVMSQFPARLDSSEEARIRERLMQSFTPIPDAQLFVIADSATETGQTAYAALVYADAAAAQAAVDTAIERLATLESSVTRRTWADLLAERSITLSASVYESASTGLAVALIALEAPPPAPPAEGEMPESSAAAFRLLVSAYMQRDLLWLATGGTE